MISFISSPIINYFTFNPYKPSADNIPLLPKYISIQEIITPDNETLEVLLFKHKRIKKKRQLTIYFHGNSGHLYECIKWARQLYRLGQDVLLVSYRGYSNSTGSPSEAGIYTDGEAALNYAIQELGFAEHQINIYGRSLGSTVAVHIAQHRQLNSVILVTPLTSGRAMAKVMGWSSLSFIAGDAFNSIRKIQYLKSRVLVIHGDRDIITPLNMGLDLFAAYKGIKDLVIIKNANHSNIQDISPKIFWKSIGRFIA